MGPIVVGRVGCWVPCLDEVVGFGSGLLRTVGCSVGRSVGVCWLSPRRRRPQIRNFIIENEVADLGHGRVGSWVG